MGFCKWSLSVYLNVVGVYWVEVSVKCIRYIDSKVDVSFWGGYY